MIRKLDPANCIGYTIIGITESLYSWVSLQGSIPFSKTVTCMSAGRETGFRRKSFNKKVA